MFLNCRSSENGVLPKEVLLNTGSNYEDTPRCDVIIPTNSHDGNSKLWSIHEKIDTSRYNFDANESFNNIDITSFMDEKLENAQHIETICNNKEKFVSRIRNGDNEVDEIIEALNQDKDKLKHALNYINSNICDGMTAKRTIQKSIADLYESMKYANDLLPDPTHLLSPVRALALDSSNNFEQPSFSNTQPLEDFIISQGEKEIYANSKIETHGKKEYEKKGK